MKVLGHPLFYVFAFTALVCMAGIWWLLRQPPERKDHAEHEQTPSLLREGERSMMEILQDVAPRIPLAQQGRVGPGGVNPHERDATQQTIMQEESKTRLALMDELIGKQKVRIASARASGMDVTLLEDQLQILKDSREEYFSTLKRLLTEFVDDEHTKNRA